MKITDYFDKAYCINLDRRPDRWEKSKKEFEKHGLDVERFSAKNGKEINLSHPYNSELGGAISHNNVIKMAKELDLENILILEDDVEFVDDINVKFQSISTQIPSDWDMIYFGGNHQGGLHKVNDHFHRMGRSYAIQCYAVNSKSFDIVTNYMDIKIKKVLDGSYKPNPSVAADWFISDLHPNLNCYVIIPHLCWQKEDFSDIQGRVVNYNFLK